MLDRFQDVGSETSVVASEVQFRNGGQGLLRTGCTELIHHSETNKVVESHWFAKTWANGIPKNCVILPTTVPWKAPNDNPTTVAAGGQKSGSDVKRLVAKRAREERASHFVWRISQKEATCCKTVYTPHGHTDVTHGSAAVTIFASGVRCPNDSQVISTKIIALKFTTGAAREPMPASSSAPATSLLLPRDGYRRWNWVDVLVDGEDGNDFAVPVWKGRGGCRKQEAMPLLRASGLACIRGLGSQTDVRKLDDALDGLSFMKSRYSSFEGPWSISGYSSSQSRQRYGIEIPQNLRLSSGQHESAGALYMRAPYASARAPALDRRLRLLLIDRQSTFNETEMNPDALATKDWSLDDTHLVAEAHAPSPGTGHDEII
ncbi:hypothetical protein DFH07DRAFT_1035394 [Mycena maculata]|uniref:Uncharacterized protein n=1 Tax=Mycena maculata TaxID=230809 RepID=A0AAD7IUD2_9AGAR|nr:hypothetical protein DFH07DRAFT_1035394 [Mycena maculata]